MFWASLFLLAILILICVHSDLLCGRNHLYCPIILTENLSIFLHCRFSRHSHSISLSVLRVGFLIPEYLQRILRFHNARDVEKAFQPKWVNSIFEIKHCLQYIISQMSNTKTRRRWTGVAIKRWGKVYKLSDEDEEPQLPLSNSPKFSKTMPSFSVSPPPHPSKVSPTKKPSAPRPFPSQRRPNLLRRRHPPCWHNRHLSRNPSPHHRRRHLRPAPSHRSDC